MENKKKKKKKKIIMPEFQNLSLDMKYRMSHIVCVTDVRRYLVLNSYMN